MFKLIAALIFVIHLLACLWHAVTYYSTYQKNALNWTYFVDGELNTNRIPSWFPKYLNCIYWSISYGKVDPQNSLEHAYGAFAAFVFEISSAFIIGGILNIIRLLSNKENEKKY